MHARATLMACSWHAHAVPMPVPMPVHMPCPCLAAHAAQVEELHEYVLRLPPGSDGQLIGASPLVMQMLVAVYASRQVAAAMALVAVAAAWQL